MSNPQITPRINDTVEYLSTCTEGRQIRGRVHAVYGDRCCVRHEGRPRYTIVKTRRLLVLPPGALPVRGEVVKLCPKCGALNLRPASVAPICCECGAQLSTYGTVRPPVGENVRDGEGEYTGNLRTPKARTGND